MRKCEECGNPSVVGEGMMNMDDYIYNTTRDLFGLKKDLVGFGSDLFYIKKIKQNMANEIIVKNHYSHKYYNLSYIHLGLFINGEMLGVLQYGYALNPASGANIVPGTGNKEYLELNRMWIDDKADKNTESKAISYSIKYIRRAFPKVCFIQSFADERCCCFGIVYQACSFDYFGEHTSVFWEYNGEYYHNIQMTADKRNKELKDNKDEAIRHELRQFRYIKFLNKRARKKCTLTIKPYPKHYQ